MPRLWYCACCIQLSAKKRYVYGAIAFIWIVIPTLQITFAALITDIQDGSCTRYAINNSYDVMKSIGLCTIILSYFLPLALMVFCYARVIHGLRSKVLFSILLTLAESCYRQHTNFNQF